MFGLILALIAVICCTAASIMDFVNEQYGLGILFAFLAILNGIFLVEDIKKLNAPKELHREQIENVVKYDIDSTTVINGIDTTKTYTIYYYKY